VASGQIWFWPKGFTVEAYRNVFSNRVIWTGYANSIVYMVSGTALNLAVTITCAFALSRSKLRGRNLIMGLFVFTMFFSGGMIPSYILMVRLDLIDTRWAMILPGAMSVWNMIITRTYYQASIPEELYDAAKIDGCSDLGIFARIALPLSTPIIAVIGLFYGVGHWNSFFNALIYLRSEALYPLQLVLRNILLLNQQLLMDLESIPAEQFEWYARQAMMAEVIKYALIFVASAPVLIAYPFVQRHFVKGVMIGAIKG
jgi:ABC-type glycerol-3-phosphate transport system permease component